MKTLVLLMAATALTACAGFPPVKGPGRVTPVAWNRNADVNPEAAKVQQMAARQGKQARCGTQVKQRQGTDGTSPRDYKCKKGSS